MNGHKTFCLFLLYICTYSWIDRCKNLHSVYYLKFKLIFLAPLVHIYLICFPWLSLYWHYKPCKLVCSIFANLNTHNKLLFSVGIFKHIFLVYIRSIIWSKTTCSSMSTPKPNPNFYRIIASPFNLISTCVFTIAYRDIYSHSFPN